MDKWLFFIEYLVVILLFSYIRLDLRRSKAKKCNFDCSTCKVKGCQGRYCANQREMLLKDNPSEPSSDMRGVNSGT